MSRPALVLFDLDGVLVHYAHARRLEQLAQRSGTSVEAVSQALFESGLEHDADRGLHDARGHAEEFERRLGVPVTLDDCIAARRAATTVDDAMLVVVEHVSRLSTVAILTNNNLMLCDHLHSICPPLCRLFEGRVFCSAQFRIAKPEPGIFMQCLAALDTKPEDALFIDDKPENAQGARRAGLRGHHYRGLPTLRAELRLLGFPEN